VELANRAIDLRSESAANDWTNLGVAQYRAGNWQTAVDALEKADAMIEGGGSIHRMFLAMARWRLGDKEKARQLYAQEAAWIAEHRKNSEEQNRFRAEAEELMEITEEEDRKRLVKEYLVRKVDKTAKEANKTPKKKSNDQGKIDSGDQGPKKVEPKVSSAEP
jgi:hypothetical protein